MGGREVHGPDWNPEWDDADRARGGNIYGRGFFLVLAVALALFLAVWLFSPAAEAGQWRIVPAGQCLRPGAIAHLLGGGLRKRLISNGITEYRRKGARVMLQLRWRGLCLDAWRSIEERSA